MRISDWSSDVCSSDLVDRERALRLALAIECIHCYSLVHDDLPCMDDDDVRRGKLTVHRAFSAATAVLAGDALHALAFDLLAYAAPHVYPFFPILLSAELARATPPLSMPGAHMFVLFFLFFPL